VKLINFNMVQS